MSDETKETVNWVRGPKTADLSEVPVGKLIEAHEERGVEVDMPTGGKGKSIVIKTAVTGMPAPKSEESK